MSTPGAAVQEELDQAECRRLLDETTVGRMAICTPQGPHLVPVSYSMVEGAVTIATSPYSLLGRHGRDTPAAFEIDDTSLEERSGWSVVVTGHLRLEKDQASLHVVREAWDRRPWIEGSRGLVLRLDLISLSGRRFHPAGVGS